MAKPAPPHAVVLGDARITINAIPAQVFEALTNPERLVEWWGDHVRADAQIGGAQAATPTDPRPQAAVTKDGSPPQPPLPWPLSHQGRPALTTAADTPFSA